MNRFDGRTVVVTGATGGLGEAICRRLASEGARVVATDLEGTPLTPLSSSLEGEGHDVSTLDVSSEHGWSTLATELSETGDRVFSLINNAGIGSLATVEDEDRDRWNEVVAIDQTGTWLGMKHLGPLISRSGGGSIVNIASILGSTGGLGNSIAYHAAKGAVRSMTKNAALHWSTGGVRVNSLHPGFIGTAQLRERFEGTKRYEKMLAGTPMGRLGTPEEIAGAVAFLASDDAGFMTGAELYIDGGWTAR